MTNEEFSKFMEERFKEILELRREKAREYTRDCAFENFESGSKFLGVKPEVVAFYYMTKHIISLRDAVLKGVGRDKIKEKVNDLIIYALLIEGMIGRK